MKRIVMSGKLLVVPAMVALCGVLASATSSVADQPDRRCSNRTLSGDYGFAIEGEILGPGLHIRGLALQHYDGRGHITQVDHLVEEGTPPLQPWTLGTGTYVVNPDCTGAATINTPSNPFPVQLHFIVVKEGREILQVVDANAVSAVGHKVN